MYTLARMRDGPQADPPDAPARLLSGTAEYRRASRVLFGAGFVAFADAGRPCPAGLLRGGVFAIVVAPQPWRALVMVAITASAVGWVVLRSSATTLPLAPALNVGVLVMPAWPALVSTALTKFSVARVS